MVARWLLLSSLAFVSCGQKLVVTALTPAASTSTTVACGDFERYWSLNADGHDVYSEIKLHRTDLQEVRRLLREAQFEPLVGGFHPVFKFRLDGSTYCVTPMGYVVKDDSLMTRSQPLYALLEDEDETKCDL